MPERLSPMNEVRSADLRYQMRTMPRIPIKDLMEGAVVKVRGYVAVEEPLAAPITGRACAAYCVEWRQVRMGLVASWSDWSIGIGQRSFTYGLPPDWDEFASAPVNLQVGGGDFSLDDGTERALVRLDQAQVSLLGVWRSSRVRDLARDAADVPGGLLRSSPPLRPEDCIEHREAVIEQGALLTVLGRATYQADPNPARPTTTAAASYRAHHGRWVLEGSAASPLLIVQELITSLDAVG